MSTQMPKETSRLPRPSLHKHPVVSGVSVLQRVSPPLATFAGKRLFAFTGKRALSNREQAVLSRGVSVCLPLKNGRCRGWRWGSGPAVLLVHGWGSCAARFCDLIERLESEGFSVLAFDKPGHGRTGGKFSSIPEFVEVIEAATRYYGPFHAVVAHSLGALAAGKAATDNDFCKKLVLISPLSSLVSGLRTFGLQTGFSQEFLSRIKSSTEHEYEVLFEDYDFWALAQELEVPTLVVHDRGDRLTSCEESERWVQGCEAAELMKTDGLGHHRILSDKAVLDSILWHIGDARFDIRSHFLTEYAL